MLALPDIPDRFHPAAAVFAAAATALEPPEWIAVSEAARRWVMRACGAKGLCLTPDEGAPADVFS